MTAARFFLFFVFVISCFGWDDKTELFFSAEEAEPHWVEILGDQGVALSWHPQSKDDQLKETLSFSSAALRGAQILVFKRVGSSDKLEVVATASIPSEGLGKKMGVKVEEGFNIRITIHRK